MTNKFSNFFDKSQSRLLGFLHDKKDIEDKKKYLNNVQSNQYDLLKNTVTESARTEIDKLEDEIKETGCDTPQKLKREAKLFLRDMKFEFGKKFTVNEALADSIEVIKNWHEIEGVTVIKIPKIIEIKRTLKDSYEITNFDEKMSLTISLEFDSGEKVQTKVSFGEKEQLICIGRGENLEAIDAGLQIKKINLFSSEADVMEINVNGEVSYVNNIIEQEQNPFPEKTWNELIDQLNFQLDPYNDIDIDSEGIRDQMIYYTNMNKDNNPELLNELRNLSEVKIGWNNKDKYFVVEPNREYMMKVPDKYLDSEAPLFFCEYRIYPDFSCEKVLYYTDESGNETIEERIN